MPISEAYNMDCMEYMEQFPDKYFDLAIVDPPYGIEWMNQIQSPNLKANWKKYNNKQWDDKIPDKEYFEQLFRVSKKQIVWGGNYMTNYLPPSPCWIIWDKMQEFSGAVFEMAWSSFTSPSKAFRMSRVEAYANKNKIHPTQKPTELYKWILNKYANQGDKILDTHLGSGSSRIAAWDMGFDFYATELDTDYFAAQEKRFNNFKMQGKLFA